MLINLAMGQRIVFAGLPPSDLVFYGRIKERRVICLHHEDWLEPPLYLQTSTSGFKLLWTFFLTLTQSGGAFARSSVMATSESVDRVNPPSVRGVQGGKNFLFMRLLIVRTSSRHKTFIQRWFDVGPPSTTLHQRETNIDSTSCVC